MSTPDPGSAAFAAYCLADPQAGGLGELGCRLARLDPQRAVLLASGGALAGALVGGAHPIAGALLGAFLGAGAEVAYAVTAPQPDKLRGKLRAALDQLEET